MDVIEEKRKKGLTLFHKINKVLKDNKDYQLWISEVSSLDSLSYEELEWLLFTMALFFTVPIQGVNSNKLFYKLLRVYFLYLDNKDGEDYKNAAMDWIQYYDRIVDVISSAESETTTKIGTNIENIVKLDFEQKEPSIERKSRKLINKIIETYNEYCRKNNKSIIYFFKFSVFKKFLNYPFISYLREDPSTIINVLNSVFCENYDDIDDIKIAKSDISSSIREKEDYIPEYIQEKLSFRTGKISSLIQCYIHFTEPIRQREVVDAVRLEEEREKRKKDVEEQERLLREEKLRLIAEDQERLRREAEDQDRLSIPKEEDKTMSDYINRIKYGANANEVLRDMTKIDKKSDKFIELWKKGVYDLNMTPEKGWITFDGGIKSYINHRSRTIRKKSTKKSKRLDGSRRKQKKSIHNKKKRKSLKKY